MRVLIKSAKIIDPAHNVNGVRDILIDAAKIAKVAENINSDADQVIDAQGKIVIPGLVDMHVHLREPGREDKETIASGTQAAVKGGVTSVLAMPNTTPAIDSPEHVRTVRYIAKDRGCCHVFISAAITKARTGKQITDIAKLKKEGIVAISDDGSSVDSADVLEKAMRKAKEHKLLVICHCEDKQLSAAGVMNLGSVSTKLGLRGISNESEYKRVLRDISLAEKTKCCVHIAHVSTQESVDIIAKAKKKGIKVTAETAPHYFSLTENDVLDYNANMKMNPPLRSKKDQEAIKRGLIKGVIDVIASDHAPHTISEKEIEFDRAEFGIIGLETELALSITYLVQTNLLNWTELVRKLCYNPARILGLRKGTLGIGADADLVIVDPECEWTLRAEDIASKSKNSPFIGTKLKGRVEYTFVNGSIAYKAAALTC